MRAIVREASDRAPRVVDIPRPDPREGSVLCRTLLTGIDATDEEVLGSTSPALPAGSSRMSLGHECLAVVEEAPDIPRGTRVVPLVRRGCGACAFCENGAADMCATGKYVEHGIKGLDGFMRERWREAPEALVRVPKALGDEAVLAEPMSIAVKAFEEARGIRRARFPAAAVDDWNGSRVLVAGTGSLGSLACILAREAGSLVTALDRSEDDAAGPATLRSIGVSHASSRASPLPDDAEFDFVVDATGSGSLAFDVAPRLAANGVMALLGVPSESAKRVVETGDLIRRLVLENQVLFGSVNSRASHFTAALSALERAELRWPGLLGKLITHRFRPEEAARAFALDEESVVKKVIEWA